MNTFLEDIVSQIYNSSIKIISVALLVALWSAGKGMMALIKAFNKIDHKQEERGYFRLRLAASGYTVITLFMILIFMGIRFGGELLMCHPFIVQLGISRFFWNILKGCIVMIILFFFVLFFYTFVPSTKKSIKGQIPGAVAVTLLWGIFYYVFSVYADHLSGFAAYGTMGIIVLLLLWIYFGSYILLIGLFFNQI